MRLALAPALLAHAAIALWAAGALTPRRLLPLTLLGPSLLFLSYPACFLLGGAALALLPAVVRIAGDPANDALAPTAGRRPGRHSPGYKASASLATGWRREC